MKRWLALAGGAAVCAHFALSMQEPEPRWWRGNMHTHTAWAEGDDFPEMAADWYRAHGYNFVALTEHNLLSKGENWKPVRDIDAKAKTDAFARYRQRFGDSWVETRNHSGLEVRLKPFDEFHAILSEAGRFLIIPAEEITDQAKNGRAIHMCASNLDEAIAPRSGATVAETIGNNLDAVRASMNRTGRDVLAAVNHPNYKWGVTAEDLAARGDLRFFEVWNGVSNDSDPGDAEHPSTDAIWDRANALRLASGVAPLYGLANDDSHNYHGNNPRAVPGRAWVMVRSRYLSPESLFRAMRSGDFYASTGVYLRKAVFDASARVLTIDIEPQKGETFVTRFVGTRKGRTDGETFAEARGEHAVYAMRGDESSVRAVITSSAPPEVESPEFGYKRAWTQPVGW
jgi:hypothetical protein